MVSANTSAVWVFVIMSPPKSFPTGRSWPISTPHPSHDPSPCRLGTWARLPCPMPAPLGNRQPDERTCAHSRSADPGPTIASYRDDRHRSRECFSSHADGLHRDDRTTEYDADRGDPTSPTHALH